MPPLEIEPPPTPPKDGGSYRHKDKTPEKSTPPRHRKADSPSDRTTPSNEKFMKENNTDGLVSGEGTPATAMSTPSSTVSSTPSSASLNTPLPTPRSFFRDLFSGPSSTSISEEESSPEISRTSLSSAQILFQKQSWDDTSGDALHHRSTRCSLPTQPGLIEEAEDIPKTIISQQAFGKHTRSASLRIDDSASSPFRTVQRRRSYSRLHDSLSLEGSFVPSCGLSERKRSSERRRSSKGRTSPNLSADTSVSSEERFPSDTSPSPTRAGPLLAYTQSHRRSSSRSSLQHSELGGDRKNPLSFWMKPLVRLAQTRGLVWLLCLVALTSLCMTIITNRSLAVTEIPIDSLTETPLIPFGRERGKSVRPYFAGLRGNLILSVGRSQRETSDLHNVYVHQEKKPTTKHADANKHGHEDKHKDKETSRKTEDVQKHKHHDDKSSKDARPVSLTALAHRQEQKTSPAKETKLWPKQHDHTMSHSEMHKAHQSSKHSYNTATTQKVTRSIPAVVFPRKTIDSKARFESQDRRLYRKPTHERKAGGAAKRVVFLDDSIAHRPPPRRKVSIYPADFTDNTQLYSILASDDERVKSMELREPYEQGDCVPMQDWQTTFHPSCNGVHELGLADIGEENGDDAFLFGTKGYWRNAWKVDLLGGRNQLKERDTIVLKTLKISHRFEEAHFEHDRIDAVAMERLTASPHVINAFGFCGHSVMTEYADGKRLGELADKIRNKPLERLKIARDIATGLADVHGINGDGNATFVHLDINPANVVSIGGTLKLNDFNIGIIRRWNTTSKKPCGFPAQYPNPQWRSPEEARDEENLTEKVDIFSMGHIFFRLICGHEPWNKLEPHGKPSKTEVNEKVKRGILPTIPQNIMHTEDTELAAIRDAMLKCYSFDPAKRPSAREIANSLQSALGQLEASPTSLI